MIMQESIENFKTFMPLLLPELFGAAKAGEADINDEVAVINFTLARPCELEDVMNMFDDQMELTILYHIVPSEHTDFGHQCCAYSDITFGHMFKIHACTSASGKVETLTVTLFTSMDVMCTDLMDDLDRHENRGNFKYKIPKENLLVEFC